jgi:CheY-like chemotaxis protein
VSDAGKGLDTATLARIFEPFFTTKPSGQGAGLGLSVVHGIVRSHGGAIIVTSKPAHGATFHLYFPATTEPAVSITTQPLAKQIIRGRNEHILFLDDEESLVYLAVRFLERHGYRVDGYTRAAEALAAFRADPQSYDLVITDYNMPMLSGMEVARQILSIQPDTLVVLASGYVRPAEIEQAQALGVREIILKPNTVEELVPVIQRLLSARASLRDKPSDPAVVIN